MKKKIQELIRDPDGAFREPAEVIERDDLSVDEKIAVLQSWQADLVELQKATEENMSDSGGDSGKTAAKLSQVTAAIEQLEQSDPKRA